MKIEDKQRRRKEWEIEQKLIKKHEKRKYLMIKKYEEKRLQRLKHDRKESPQSENLEEQRNKK